MASSQHTTMDSDSVAATVLLERGRTHRPKMVQGPVNGSCTSDTKAGTKSAWRCCRNLPCLPLKSPTSHFRGADGLHLRVDRKNKRRDPMRAS